MRVGSETPLDLARPANFLPHHMAPLSREAPPRRLVSSTPLIETFVRGSLLYLGLVVLLRLTPAREAGAVGTPDLLVILLLADAAQNAMAGPHHAVGDGFALLVTILAWSVVLDWLSSARLLSPALADAARPPRARPAGSSP